MASFEDLDDNLGNFGAIQSAELAINLRSNFNYLYSSLSVGAIAPIMTNIPGVPAPNPNIWQECDGSEILNPDSPLRSLPGDPKFTPNFTDKYLRITTVLGTVGQSGGVNSFSGWGHQHTIGEHNPPTAGAIEDKDTTQNAGQHGHGVNLALGAVNTNMEPLFYTLKYFMRIQ